MKSISRTWSWCDDCVYYINMILIGYRLRYLSISPFVHWNLSLWNGLVKIHLNYFPNSINSELRSALPRWWLKFNCEFIIYEFGIYKYPAHGVRFGFHHSPINWFLNRLLSVCGPNADVVVVVAVSVSCLLSYRSLNIPFIAERGCDSIIVTSNTTFNVNGCTWISFLGLFFQFPVL